MNWPVKPLGEICEIVSGITKDSKKQGGGFREVPYLRVANVQRLRLDLSEVKTIPAKESAISSYRLEPGDILLNEGGDRDKLGRGWIWQGQISECIHQNHVFRARIRSGEAIPKWIAYYANTNESRAYFLATGKQTTNLASISKKNLSALPVPLPSIDIQECIVSEIDTQLSRLDEMVATLQGIQAKLKQARASILKAAVVGRLVRINHVINGRSALQADDYGDDIFPSHWQRSTIGQACEVSGGITKNATKGQGGILMPYLRVANVYANNLDLTEVKSIQVPEHLLGKYLLNKGDLLIVEGNGSIDQLGRVAIWDGSINSCVHQNHLIKARPRSPSSAKYLLAYLNSPLGRSQIKEVSTSTSGLHTLSISKIERIEIPLPPENEIREIIAEVERRFSVLDKVETTVQASLARCALLRQAILKRAFEGRLVPAPPEPLGP